MTTDAPLALRIRAIREEAQGIHSFELVEAGGAPLPAFTAGAHITLHLPGGLARSYSLIDARRDGSRYVVAVNRDAASRGGSRYLHERARVGEEIKADPPRNQFELDEAAPMSVFIAGGIGITPIRAMILRLEELGRPWRLHYCARQRGAAAFLAELEGDERVQAYFDQGEGARRLDIGAVVDALPEDAHVYCCGPSAMLDDYVERTAGLAQERVHYERFAAEQAPASGGGYRVQLARSGRTVAVQPGQTILDALLAAGLQPPHSCTQGVCGSCETPVLAGRPDHRDQVLTDGEKAAGRTMMICCSGSLDEELVLDI